MRKKSHIAVASYISSNLMDSTYKKSFCIGSVLPDFKPSFLTTKHEFFGTFDRVETSIMKLADKDKQGIWYHIQLGQIIHYIADYFTLPHNVFCNYSFTEHCVYERELKFRLKDYLQDNKFEQNQMLHFSSIKELITYIREKHKEYSEAFRVIDTDCNYIFSLCCQVIYTLIHMPASLFAYSYI